jgi:hypothetical protein
MQMLPSRQALVWLFIGLCVGQLPYLLGPQAGKTDTNIAYDAKSDRPTGEPPKPITTPPVSAAASPVVSIDPPTEPKHTSTDISFKDIVDSVVDVDRLAVRIIFKITP